jgi:hypothetical protein
VGKDKAFTPGLKPPSAESPMNRAARDFLRHHQLSSYGYFNRIGLCPAVLKHGSRAGYADRRVLTGLLRFTSSV